MCLGKRWFNFGYQAGNYANPHAVTKISTTTLTYDRNGNMTSDGTWTNTWDWRNQLTQSTSGTTTVTYTYDHDGNRVSQSSTSGSSLVYPNSYYTVDGTETKRHIMAGALGSVATSTYDGTDSELVYHHKDHLGGTHVETDESGAVLEYILYKPFGGTLVDTTTGSYSNDLKFTGKEKDSDTGYYYYGARYYMADYGRFMSQDPVYLGIGSRSGSLLTDPQSLNSYSYARNNPINFYDPDGQFGEWVWKIFGVAETFFNVGTAVLPGLSDARDFAEVAAGRDLISGQALTDDQRALTAGFLLYAPLVASGAEARWGAEHLDEASSAINKAFRTTLGDIAGTASRTNWGKAGTLQDHFVRHGGQFGADSMESYANMAQNFYQRGMSDANSGIEHFVGIDRRIRMYDKGNNTFGSFDGNNGSTFTFFKPDRGADYWSDQKLKYSK